MTDDPKVVRIDGAPLDQKFDVEEQIVETLEMFLRLVRSGEIKSMAVVALSEDYTCTTFDHSGRGMAWVPLIGAIARLQHSIQLRLDDKPNLLD